MGIVEERYDFYHFLRAALKVSLKHLRKFSKIDIVATEFIRSNLTNKP